MPKIEVPFANQEGQSSVTQNSQERLVNMFCEVQISGKSKLVRRQRMSVEQVRAQTGEKRCIEKNAGVYYTVIGTKFATWDGSTYTERGTLDTGTGRCTMVFDDNGDALISDGATAYHWDGATFTEPDTQGDIGPLTFIGGFAVGNTPGTGQFKWSAVNDMQAWDGLDFATAEGNTDDLVRVYAAQNELWLFGQETTEIWPLSGGSDSPFSYNAAMQRGCGAALSVVAEDNSLFWLGNDWIIYRADGFRPMAVSNPSVQEAINAVPEASRRLCEAFSYTDGFNKFVTFNFPDYVTLQYNVATQFWNICRTYGQEDWDILASQYSQCDRYLTTSGIARLVRGINTDNGDIFQRGGTSPQLAAGNNRVALRSFLLDCEVGRAAEDVEPQVMMRKAKDGVTFGNERLRSLGIIGEYRHRVIWRNCGMGRRMTIEVWFTDDAEFSIIGAEADGDILNG
jgi:hypothetical protein